MVNIQYIDAEQYEYFLGRSIYKDGVVLLEKDVKLTTGYIRLLLSKNINYVYVNDEISEGIDIIEMIPNERYIEMKNALKDEFNFIKRGKDIGLNMNMINDTASSLLDSLIAKRNITYNLDQIKTNDDYLYEHSLNVAIACLYTGISLGYNKMKLQKLALGALLHDIGKLFVNQEILNKPQSLTINDRMEVEKHPELGYRYINDKNYDEISPMSKQIILQHHEKWNGNGYPNQLSGNSIYELARICSVCDVFDALTSDRIYRKGMYNYQACEYIYGLGNIEFDFEIVKVFLSKVVKFKEGKLVKLSDNSKAIVFKQSSECLDRPLVRLLIDKNGVSLKHKHVFLDLTESRTLFIEKEIDTLLNN